MSEPERKKKKMVQSDIFKFLKKNENKSEPESPSLVETTSTLPETVASPASENEASCSSYPAVNDIGYAVGRNLSAEDRQCYLKPWKPSSESDMPSSMHIKSGVERCRRLLPIHMKNFPWLAVSQVPGQIGAFCVPCVLFSKSGVGGRSCGFGQLPGKLVTKPLDRFDDLTGKNGALSCHQNKEYHKRSVVDMINFKKIFRK